MRSRYWLLLLALGPATALAWGDGCKFTRGSRRWGRRQGCRKGRPAHRRRRHEGRRPRQRRPHRSARRGLRRQAGTARRDADQRASRRQCRLRRNRRCRRTGRLVFGNNEYAYIDIGIALPSSIPVEATDSSGDADFEDLKALTLQDSSGDLEIGPHRRTRRRQRQLRRHRHRRTRAACACATARATSKSTKCAATSKWCSTARATSTSRRSTAASRCGRTARAAFASKT